MNFSSFSSRDRIPKTSMGPSADHPFPYPPPSDHNLALAQAPFVARELGVKALDSSFSKCRYPRCDMGMAPSSLAPATCNRRLGQTLVPLATLLVEVLSPRAPPLLNLETLEVNVTHALPKRRGHATCLLRCTLLTSCANVAHRT
jgi:hypothetical protein